MSNESNSFASGRFFDSEGQLISLSWQIDGTIDSFNDDQAQKVHQVIAVMRRNGFTTNPPDVLQGEMVEEVHFVARRQKINDDDSETPIIDCYAKHEKMNRKFFSHYLNTAEDVAAFEQATGVTVASLPIFMGKVAVEKDDRVSKQYIRPAAHVGKIVLKPNPAYDKEDEKKKMKPSRLFVRWVGIGIGLNNTGEDGSGSPKGTTGQPDGANGSGQNAGSGERKTDIQPHWTTIKANRDRIIEAFTKAGAHDTKAMIAAMQIIEPNVTKLGETQAKTLDEYLTWIDQRYAKLGQTHSEKGADLSRNNPYGKQPGETFADELGEIHIIQEDGTDFVDKSDAALSKADDDAPESYDWTDAEQKKFTKEILALYPGLSEAQLWLEMGIKNWISHPNYERQAVAEAARDLGWKVMTSRVGYRKTGEGEKDGHFVFHTPVGEINYYKGATEFTQMVSGSWARPNKVSKWRTLTEPLEIEPLVISWEVKKRESDGVEYLILTKAETSDTLDKTLEGDSPLS